MNTFPFIHFNCHFRQQKFFFFAEFFTQKLHHACFPSTFFQPVIFQRARKKNIIFFKWFEHSYKFKKIFQENQCVRSRWKYIFHGRVILALILVLFSLSIFCTQIFLFWLLSCFLSVLRGFLVCWIIPGGIVNKNMSCGMCLLFNMDISSGMGRFFLCWPSVSRKWKELMSNFPPCLE